MTTLMKTDEDGDENSEKEADEDSAEVSDEDSEKKADEAAEEEAVEEAEKDAVLTSCASSGESWLIIHQFQPTCLRQFSCKPLTHFLYNLY